MDLEHIYQLPIMNEVPTVTWEEESDSVSVQSDGHGSAFKEYESDSNDESDPRNIVKKPATKGPVKMKCSLKQFVTLLENLLVFHTMYLFRPATTRLSLPNVDVNKCRKLICVVTGKSPWNVSLCKV
jgi:hypothetical protein